VKEPPRRLN